MKWWWPVFVGVYPWALWPDGTHTIASSYLEHYIFAGVAVAGWILLLLADKDATWSNSFRNLLASVRSNPPLAAAIAFGAWVIAASIFSPEPSISLTGSIEDYSGSALYMVVLVIIYNFIYLYYYSHDTKPIFKAIVFSALLLVLASTYEVITGNAVFYSIKPERHPMVSFLGYGHLAGFLALASGLLVSLPSRLPILMLLFLLSLGMGLTNNRSSVLATLLSATAVNLYFSLKKVLLLLLVITIGVLAGWIIVNYSGGNLRSDMARSTTLEARLAYWKMALSGIRERPLTGWGGGQYYLHLGDVAKPADIKVFLQSSDISLLYYSSNIFMYKDKYGTLRMEKISSWSAHNFMLDIALDFGIPGLLLYLLLVYFNLRNCFLGNPAAVATITYHVFLLMWPIAIEASAVLWIVMALGALPKKPSGRFLF